MEQIAYRDRNSIWLSVQWGLLFTTEETDSAETLGDIPHIFSFFKEKYVKTQTSLKLKTFPIDYNWTKITFFSFNKYEEAGSINLI